MTPSVSWVLGLTGHPNPSGAALSKTKSQNHTQFQVVDSDFRLIQSKLPFSNCYDWILLNTYVVGEILDLRKTLGRVGVRWTWT